MDTAIKAERRAAPWNKGKLLRRCRPRDYHAEKDPATGAIPGQPENFLSRLEARGFGAEPQACATNRAGSLRHVNGADTHQRLKGACAAQGRAQRRPADSRSRERGPARRE